MASSITVPPLSTSASMREAAAMGADHLAVAPGPRRRRQSKHRHGLQQVRLALAVVADEHVDARTGREV